MNHEKYMFFAIKEAEKALKTGDVPIGALAILDSKIIARAHNEKEKRKDATCHAELLCLKRAAKKTKHWRMDKIIFYSTLEPCPMCAAALVLCRINTLVFGATDPKSGACGGKMNLANNKKLNHRVKIVRGVLHDECSKLIKSFFKKLR